MPGYVYRGNRPFNPNDPNEREFKPGFPGYPCGTEQAWKRHRSKGEKCEECEAAHLIDLKRRRAERDRATVARQRAKRQAEAEAKFGAPNPPDPRLAPCGTPAAYRRHRRYYQPVDKACHDAYIAYRRVKTAKDIESRRKRKEAKS